MRISVFVKIATVVFATLSLICLLGFQGQPVLSVFISEDGVYAIAFDQQQKMFYLMTDEYMQRVMNVGVMGTQLTPPYSEIVKDTPVFSKGLKGTYKLSAPPSDGTYANSLVLTNLYRYDYITNVWTKDTKPAPSPIPISMNPDSIGMKWDDQDIVCVPSAIDLLRSKIQDKSKLVGTWKTTKADAEGGSSALSVTELSFYPDGFFQHIVSETIASMQYDSELTEHKVIRTAYFGKYSVDKNGMVKLTYDRSVYTSYGWSDTPAGTRSDFSSDRKIASMGVTTFAGYEFIGDDLFMAYRNETLTDGNKLFLVKSFDNLNHYVSGITSSVKEVPSNDPSLNYKLTNMLDFDLASSWQGLSKNGCIGEWVEFTFKQAVDLYLVDLVNGFSLWGEKWGDLWMENNRLKKISLAIDNDTIGTYLFKDDGNILQEIETQAQGIAKIRVYIKDVYWGSKWKDTVITDVVLYGSAGN